jgi:Cys-tRNA(Pro) deacylase
MSIDSAVTAVIAESVMIQRREPMVAGQRTASVYHARVAKHPVTMAIRTLRAANVAFEPHLYAWQPHGGTRASAEALDVDEHAVIKTLIFEDDRKQPLCILMHGDREVSAKNLARAIGTKTVQPCTPEVADRHSGYQVGGTSPFGLKRQMPVYMQQTILDLPRIYINGGARGFLVSIDPREAERVLKPTLVDVAVS